MFEDRIDTREMKEMHFDPDEFERYRLHDGDVLLNEGQSPELLGRPAIYRGDPGDCAFTNSLIRFQAGSTVDPRWALAVFRHHMHSGRFAKESRITTNIAHLSIGRLRGVEFPVPPLSDQRRIIDILEAHLSRLEAADTALATAGRRLARLRQARLDRAVTAAAAADGTRRLRIGELARVGSGATPLRANSAFYDGGSIPWVTSGDLRQGLITTTSRFITEVALRETAVKLWPAGTLLVAMYGEGKTRGTVGELGLAATTNQACAAIDLTSGFSHLRGWIRLFFEANYWQLRRQAAGGVQPNLSLGRIKDFVVPIPKPALARALTVIDRDLREEESRVAVAAAAARHRAGALRRALLQAAFAGQLTPRTSVDELEEMASAR